MNISRKCEIKISGLMIITDYLQFSKTNIKDRFILEFTAFDDTRGIINWLNKSICLTCIIT